MSISKLTFALLAMSFMSSALAEDKFSGFYAGVHAGYVDAEDKGKQIFNGSSDGWTQKNSPDSALFGALAGFNKVLENNVLVGLEADYEYRGDSDKSAQKSDGIADPRYTVKTKLKDAASIRARIGYIFNDGNTLGYVTGGYAAAKVERTFTEVGYTSESDSKWHDGWTVGLGAEHFINDKISLKAEYRYSDYNHENVSTANIFGEGYKEHQKYEDEQSIRLGAMYHF